MNDVNFKPGTAAKVIKDSISEDGNRLTTLEVTFHRFVLAEFNTHRVFSRNSASSRAIPFSKQVERVRNAPAIPVEWRQEQRGMQGGDLLVGGRAAAAEAEWLNAADSAIKHAEYLASLGVHKSIVNRLLEPFMWHTVIVTATDWDGFWEQRCHEAAQPEIHTAADAMYEAYGNSTPRVVGYGEWHMPYIDEEDYDAAEQILHDDRQKGSTRQIFGGVTTILRQVSAARCARVSYLTHDGNRSIEKDLELYARLVVREASTDPIHWSPLEHVATPASYADTRAGDVLGNFTGWHQLRHWRL